MPYAGQLLALHEGQQVELEVLGGDPGEDAVGEVGGRWVQLLPEPGGGLEQLVVGDMSWRAHQNAPASASSVRSLARHRPRVGPMLPTGIPSCSETTE